MNVTPMTRQQISTTANPAGMVDPDQKTVWPAAGKAIAQGARAALRGSEWQNSFPAEAQRPAMPTSQERAATPPAPVISPEQKVYNDVQKEVADVRAKSALNASAAGIETRNLPSRDQIKRAILEKNGLINQTPVTARPGTTLSATPETPRKPLVYNGAFAGGGPEVRAQEALQRKQMEVMAAERADKTLLTAPGSRDYISPTLTEEQMRARQAEIATQRKQDGEDVAAQQINNATIKALDDQAKGITSDRNLGMMPYAQRRAVINDRRALADLNANMQAKRLEEQGKAADRTAEMTRAEMEDSTRRRGQDMVVDVAGKKLTSEERRAAMTDSTTRRGQDVEQQTTLSNSEIAARSKALDREATLEAARIRKTVPVDRVKIEAIKGYNKFIGDQIGLNPELQNDPTFLERAMKMYGLRAEDLTTAMPQSNPLDDDEFPTPSLFSHFR